MGRCAQCGRESSAEDRFCSGCGARLEPVALDGFATLYTAVYHPMQGRVEYRWPDFAWPQSFAICKLIVVRAS